jgi:hypothetical protein
MTKVQTEAGLVQINDDGKHFWFSTGTSIVTDCETGKSTITKIESLIEMQPIEIILFKELVELREYKERMESEDMHDGPEN